MRYTHAALLLFGAGLGLGLVVVAADAAALGRVASGLMALGIASLPLAMFVDWRRATRPAAKPRRKPRRRAPARRRRRSKPVASNKTP